MKREDLLSFILDAIPHRIVFIDTTHTIRYLNKRAKFHYYQERGYGELIGRSILECHADQSSKQIEAILQRLDDHGDEEFLHVNDRSQRVYVTPVRDDQGELLGYFERFEGNFTRG